MRSLFVFVIFISSEAVIGQAHFPTIFWVTVVKPLNSKRFPNPKAYFFRGQRNGSTITLATINSK